MGILCGTDVVVSDTRTDCGVKETGKGFNTVRRKVPGGPVPGVFQTIDPSDLLFLLKHIVNRRRGGRSLLGPLDPDRV